MGPAKLGQPAIPVSRTSGPALKANMQHMLFAVAIYLVALRNVYHKNAKNVNVYHKNATFLAQFATAAAGLPEPR